MASITRVDPARLGVAFLVSPLIWPWVFDAVATATYVLLTGITIQHHWLTPLNNPHFFYWGYGLMIVFGGPLAYVGTYRKWARVWPYLLIGLAAGLFAPVVYFCTLAISGSIGTGSDASTAVVELLASQIHTVSASTTATGAMLLLFWLIGVRGSALYRTAV